MSQLLGCSSRSILRLSNVWLGFPLQEVYLYNGKATFNVREGRELLTGEEGVEIYRVNSATFCFNEALQRLKGVAQINY